MTPNDPRALVAALQLLLQSVAANSAAVLANTQEQQEANRQTQYSKVVGGSYRTRLDDLMGKHVGAGDNRRFDYDADGNLGSTTSGNGSVGKQPGKPGERSQLGSKAAEAIGNKLEAASSLLAARFAAVVGPLAVLGQIISSNASGFQILSSSVKLFAATLAPVLLPVVMVLAAGMVYASDLLWDRIAPELESFYSKVVTKLLPAVGAFVDKLVWAVEFIQRLTPGGPSAGDKLAKEGEKSGMSKGDAGLLGVGADAMGFVADAAGMGAFKNGANSLLSLFGAGEDGGKTTSGPAPGSAAWEAARGPVPGSAAWEAARSSAGGGGDYGGDEAGPGAKPKRSMLASFGEVLQEFRKSIGPSAQFTGLAQVSKNAQLAALNQSPFEQKMLERVTEALAALQRVEANTRKGGLAP